MHYHAVPFSQRITPTNRHAHKSYRAHADPGAHPNIDRTDLYRAGGTN